MKELKWLLFDWSDTLMFDNPKQSGEMYLWDEITLMSGVRETLPLLSAKYNCAVVSNASDSNAETMKKAFERMEIDGYFKLFITSKEIGFKKPDERFFIYISELLHTPFEQICMIGNDCEKDIVTPFRLGMRTVFINSEARSCPQADKVISDFSQLDGIL